MSCRTTQFCSLCTLLMLCACFQPAVESNQPEVLDFNTDARILRGTWTGTGDSGLTLRLEAQASSPTAEGYEVSGRFNLYGKNPVPFLGAVRVPLTQGSVMLKPRESSTCPAPFTAVSPDGRWELCGDAPKGAPPQFEVTLLDRGAQTDTFTITKTSVEANLLVSGDIVYVQGGPYTHPEAFEFTEASHAVVQLWYSWSAGGDAPGELLAETRLENITSFPLSYSIKGDPQKAFLRQGDYFLQVEVFSGAGDELKVGDLMNEMFTPVPSPGATVDVEVEGLESCASPDVGGVCAEP